MTGSSPATADRALDLKTAISGRDFLITGAGGWIGSALARTLAAHGAHRLVLLELSEAALYATDREMANQSGCDVQSVLGSAGDASLLRECLERFQPEVIFHAAAYKHVPLSERNPFAVIQNNALGTRTLADLAAEYGSAQLIMVSTDKAVAPRGIMGASKRLGELSLFGHRGHATQRAVRLANVLGSPGSVAPLFQEQIEHGEALTVTDPRAERYFLSLEQVIHLLLSAMTAPTDCTLLVPVVEEPVRIADLARSMLGGRANGIRFTGLRPGDKLRESLLATTETCGPLLPGGLSEVTSAHLPSPQQIECVFNDLCCAVERRDLPLLLKAVHRVVPDYVPGALLLSQAGAQR